MRTTNAGVEQRGQLDIASTFPLFHFSFIHSISFVRFIYFVLYSVDISS